LRLKAQNSDIQIEGMAGERMLEAGCVQLWDKNLANVMGFSEVLWMTNKYRSLSVLLIKIHLKWKQTQHQISGFFNFLNPVFAPKGTK
jgi:lipid A disaccharide synthetase